MDLKPGLKLRSAVSDAELVVVRAPKEQVDLRCGGVPLLRDGEQGGSEPGETGGEGVLLGKRYADEELGLELLCVKAGAGELTCNGRALLLKGAKPLPSSD